MKKKELKTWQRALWLELDKLHDSTDPSKLEVALWQEYIQGNGSHFSQHHIGSLLEAEIAYMQKKKRLPKVADNVTLVILVGESLQPLLQSIHIYQPKRLIAVFNEAYGDDYRRQIEPKRYRIAAAYWDVVEQILTVMPSCNAQPLTIEQDAPNDVFDKLQTAIAADLTNPQIAVVIDITGAKKIMSAGAFLLAAFTEAQISYVNPTELERGRPFGFSAEFQVVGNPIDRFALREWQQIERLYRQHDFFGALNILAPIIHTFDDATNRLEQFRLFLTICDSWENGLFKQANADQAFLNHSFRSSIPASVAQLAPLWPESDGTAELVAEFFKQPQSILLYARDEFERIKRLTTLDDEKTALNRRRSAFSRAFALHETLLKARVMQCYYAGDYTLVPCGDWDFDSDHLAKFEWRLIHKVGEDANWRLLSGQQQKLDVTSSKKAHFEIAFSAKLFEKPSEFEGVRDTRNRVAHSYFPVGEVRLLEVIALVEGNLHNYETHWASPLSAETRLAPPRWDEVVKQFELDRWIPARNIGA